MANISPIKLVLPLFGKRTMPICATSCQYISTGMIPRTWYFSLRESTDAYWHALNARMSIYARNIDAIRTKSLRERSQCIAIRKPKHRVPMAATIITSIFFGHMRITGRSSVVCSWSSIVVPPPSLRSRGIFRFIWFEITKYRSVCQYFQTFCTTKSCRIAPAGSK